MQPLLTVTGLKTWFSSAGSIVKAVDGVDFTVPQGEAVGVVGESGCGKSVMALSLMRLVAPPGRILGGQVVLNGRDLLGLPEPEMRKIRGREMAIVFQEPMTSMNPVLTIGYQIEEALAVHTDLSVRARRERVVELLELVGIPDPRRAARGYPHEYSGGMRQRALIAMALSCEPSLLIADEPTTALDVTIQAQVLELLQRLREKLKMALILITHDLGVVAEHVSQVLVMYAGRIVEQASTANLFDTPRHPYTRALLACLPDRQGGGRLGVIQGSVPDLARLPLGCSFQDRCERVQGRCRAQDPELVSQGESKMRCFYPY